jgi:hypothetical protein
LLNTKVTRLYNLKIPATALKHTSNGEAVAASA